MDQNSNTSRNLDADGNPLYPSVYEFEEFIMINKAGDEKDITPLVTSLVIAEEIYSPVLTGKLRIRDNKNFFEEFGLDGQEIVKVGIKYLNSVKDLGYKTLTYEFVVKDYPLFEKTKESINVQEYEINLISPIAYLSRLQQISRSVVGDPVEAINEIFKNDLSYSNFKALTPCQINNLKAIITKRTPLQAVEYLRGLCHDVQSSPFFIYATLKEDSIIAKSWVDIIGNLTNPIYEPTSTEDSYSVKPFTKEKAGTTESLLELRPKIISLSSNIKLDKLSQAVAGGIGSVIEVVDLENRTYNELKEFSLSGTQKIQQPQQQQPITIVSAGAGDFQSILGVRRIPIDTSKLAGSKEFNFKYLQNLDFINDKILNRIVDDPTASRSLRYIPADPYPIYNEAPAGELTKIGSYLSPALIKANYLPYTKKYLANMESAVHEIGVYGDPNLSASTKIRIKIPKAVDTEETEPGIDESLSGVYIISTSIHTFENGVYTNRLRIIKDSGGPIPSEPAPPEPPPSSNSLLTLDQYT